MEKLIQRVVILFFIVSVAIFAVSTIKTRDVKDTNGPEISMDSDTVTISLKDDDAAILAGVQAVDRRDGDVTGTMVVQGLSNFVEKGRRRATLVAFDSDLNVSKVSRDVVYTDYISPRITLEAPLKYQTSGNYSIETVFEVEDCLDGDISENMQVTNNGSYMEPEKPGDYPMIFTVTNSAGDMVQLPVTLTFYDVAKENSNPSVLLDKYLIYKKVGDGFDPKNYIDGIKVGGRVYTQKDADNDRMPEDLSFSDININNGVDLKTPGVYEVTYSIEGEDSYISRVRLIVIVEE